MARRITKYESHVKPRLSEIGQWYREGAIDEDVAKKLGIAKVTLWRYISIHEELAKVVNRGKDIADAEVEAALYRRAVGFEYVEETVKTRPAPGENGAEIVVERKTTTKTVLPDTTAGIFWLKNRQPERWRDVQKHDHGGKLTVEVISTFPETGPPTEEPE